MKRGGQPSAELSAFGDHRTRQARPGVAGGLGFVVVRVAVNNQAPAHDVADTAADCDAAGLKAELCDAAGVGLQVGKIARVVDTDGVLAVRLAVGVEVPAGAQAVAAGAIAFFMAVSGWWLKVVRDLTGFYPYL